MPLDSSVWVEHLRIGLSRLAALLLEAEVLIHPWVIGEIACGHLRNQREVIQLLQNLPAATS
jgi:predicted nucleic acid-binding protein